MNNLRKSILALVAVLLSSVNAYSQLPPDPDIPCNPEIDPLCIPVSDHIGFLVAAMLMFGIFKTIQYSRKSVNA